MELDTNSQAGSSILLLLQMTLSSASNQLARVAGELEAVKDLEESVLNLNYCSLHEIPEQLLYSEYCKKRLQKLYLKGNCISGTTLVCDI